MQQHRRGKSAPYSLGLVMWCYVLLLSVLLDRSQALSSPPPPTPKKQLDTSFTDIPRSMEINGDQDPTNGDNSTDGNANIPELISRRDVMTLPLAVGGAWIYGTAVSTALGSLGLSRPAAHEQRVADTIRRALVAAMPPSISSSTLRVLEVGIGADCRLLRGGLYNSALQAVASVATKSSSTSVNNDLHVEITGVDLTIPKSDTVQDAQALLDQVCATSTTTSGRRVSATIQVQEGNVETKLPFADGTFDAVICCLTLCSVTDPILAVRELQRLIRPNGGTLGYVEHVAVNPSESYRFLEWQQTTLDPLQQLVADNCHLHRFTENTIRQVFGVPDDDSASKQQPAISLVQDRFLVDKMWPVSCQCCGVIQRQA